MYKRTPGGFALLALFVAACIWMLYLVPVPLGIDLRGGTELIYQLDLRHIAEDPAEVANEVKDIIARRLNARGLKELSVAVVGQDRLVVQLPGGDAATVKGLKEQVEKSGSLSFRLVASGEEHARNIDTYEANQKDYEARQRAWAQEQLQWEKRKESDPDYTVPPPREPEPPPFVVRVEEKRDANDPTIVLSRRKMVLENTPGSVVDGKYLATVATTTDNNLRPAVFFSMSGEGASLLGDLTGRNIGRQMAIVLDDVVQSAPVIKARITTSGIIEGHFTAQEVKELVTILRGGSLPTKPKLSSENSVGPVLGRASVRSGVQAVLFGLAAVMVFIAIYYLAAGLVANFALIFNVIVVLAYVATFRQDLTLPGIAGILLTIGMAVDANILIFERVREERRRGKGLRQALANGYQRAFSVIFDSNLTTVITGLVLFNFGTGPVKGFAVTLIAGIIVSFVSALFVTRLILSLALNMEWIKKLAMIRAFDTPRVPFVSFQRAFLGASIVAIAATWALVGYRGKENYGIDFTGGARVRMNLTRKQSREEMEELVKTLAVSQPELFRDYSVQTIDADENDRSRQFALLTRAGARTSGEAEAQSSREAPRGAPGDEGAGSEPGPEAPAPPKEETANGAPPTETAEEAGEAEEAAAPEEAPRPEAPETPPPGKAAPPEAPPEEAPRPEAPKTVQPSTPTTGDEGEETEGEANRVRRALEAMLAAKGLLMPEGFPAEPTWTKEKDSTKEGMSVEVNLESVDPTMTPDDLKEKLTARLQQDPLFTAIACERAEVVGKTPASAEDPDKLMITRYRVELTPYDVPLPGETSDRPTKEQALALVRAFFSDPPQAGEDAASPKLFELSVPFHQVATVGPRVASDLQGKAVVAIFISMLGIIFYISLRFEFIFGIAAIAALIHDVLITLGVMALTDHLLGDYIPIKINLPELAALLTIIGYSINDTIVVFDRIRENLKIYAKKKLSFRDCVDMSINQTLSRTVWTSLTTLLTVLALLILGGEAVRGFAYTFAVGLVAGTYSSVFVASPVLIMLHERAEARREAALA